MLWGHNCNDLCLCYSQQQVYLPWKHLLFYFLSNNYNYLHIFWNKTVWFTILTAASIYKVVTKFEMCIWKNRSFYCLSLYLSIIYFWLFYYHIQIVAQNRKKHMKYYWPSNYSTTLAVYDAQQKIITMSQFSRMLRFSSTKFRE